MSKEFICMQEDVSDTQKKIRTWVSSGYEIEIVAQCTTMWSGGKIEVVTSLWRTKL